MRALLRSLALDKKFLSFIDNKDNDYSIIFPYFYAVLRGVKCDIPDSEKHSKVILAQ